MSMPSSSWTAVTVTVCAVCQFAVVKWSEAVSAGAPDDATRTIVPAGASACTVTGPVGCEASTTV